MDGCHLAGSINSTHVGWIPCVSGHLDFGLMKVGLSGDTTSGTKRDKNPITINFANWGQTDDNGRRVLLSSWVDWRDKRPEDGEFRVLLVAETNRSNDIDNRYLSGAICILPKEYEQTHPEAYAFFLDEAIILKNTWDNNKLGVWETFQTKLNVLWEGINTKVSTGMVPDCGAEEIYFIQFFVDHTGLTYLNYSPSKIDADHHLESRSKYVVIRQAFYYLKYALHMHKHHQQDSDAVTTIVERDVHNPTNDGKRLIAQLKRELGSIKRTQKNSSEVLEQSDALGIMGYMKSLMRSCLDKGLLTPQQYDREKDWLAGVKESFNAQRHRLATTGKSGKDAGQWARQWVTLLVASASVLLLNWVNYNKPRTVRIIPDNAELLSSVLGVNFIDFLVVVSVWLAVVILLVKSFRFCYLFKHYKRCVRWWFNKHYVWAISLLMLIWVGFFLSVGILYNFFLSDGKSFVANWFIL